MSRKHRHVEEPYARDARNSRADVHVYYPVDGTHRTAFQGGRCFKCGKITNSFCDKCSAWACESHLESRNGIDYCEKCLSLKEI